MYVYISHKKSIKLSHKIMDDVKQRKFEQKLSNQVWHGCDMYKSIFNIKILKK